MDSLACLRQASIPMCEECIVFCIYATKEETKLFIIAKKTVSSVQKIQMFGYSSVGSLQHDNFVAETFLYNICLNRPWNEGKLSIFIFFDSF